VTAAAQQPLTIFDKTAAYKDYDTAARALPDCEHNQAWWKLGSGRPQPPDCEHNRLWRTALRTAWVTYLAASANAECQP
jgi:hypothetical protein